MGHKKTVDLCKDCITSNCINKCHPSSCEMRLIKQNKKVEQLNSMIFFVQDHPEFINKVEKIIEDI